MCILWSFLARFNRDRRSFSLASALTIEFLMVVVGEEGRRDGRGDGETEGAAERAVFKLDTPKYNDNET